MDIEFKPLFTKEKYYFSYKEANELCPPGWVILTLEEYATLYREMPHRFPFQGDDHGYWTSTENKDSSVKQFVHPKGFGQWRNRPRSEEARVYIRRKTASIEIPKDVKDYLKLQRARALDA